MEVDWNTTLLRHICEVCGKEEDLTPYEAYQQGWDYPPGIGAFRVVSPRTCGDCGIDKTFYWRIVSNDMKPPDDITKEEMDLVERILGEPESIKVDSG